MNAVVIVLDTFRYDIIGENQKLSFVSTPSLDQFQRQSVSFDEAYGEGQPTLQVRRALYTGRRSFPWRYNFDRRGHWHHAPGRHKIPPEHDTLAEILSARGYTTGLVADVYHMFKPTMNFWRGFHSYDFIRGQESDNYRIGSIDSIRDRIARHVREPIDYSRHATLIQYLFNMQERESEEDYLCAKVMRSASRWLEDNTANSPFLLWVEAFDPHEPWDPPPRFPDRYAPGYEGKDFIMPGAGIEGGGMSEEEIERTKALYFGEVTFLDTWVGMLLEKIDELKLFDDTVVMILSDHGTQVYDKKKFGKNAAVMHPFNIKIPWMIRHPGGPAGVHIDGFVQTHDVMPTLLDILDIEHESDGESAWPLVTGGKSSIRDTIVDAWAEFRHGTATARVSVIDKEWHLVHAAGREEENPELYNRIEDPEESSNVYDDNPGIASGLKSHIERVIGEPLPGQLIEMCDPAGPPIRSFMKNRPKKT